MLVVVRDDDKCLAGGQSLVVIEPVVTLHDFGMTIPSCAMVAPVLTSL